MLFGSGTIDDNTFQIFFLEQTRGTLWSQVPFWAKLPVRDGDVPVSALIPVRVDDIDASGRIRKATGLPQSTSGVTTCTGAAVVLDPQQIGRLKGRRLMIELKCDFMIDTEGRFPIDGNFLLGNLPTGDAVPGGTFWSWVVV